MLSGFSEISVYAYEGGEIATHGVKKEMLLPKQLLLQHVASQ